MDPKHYCILLAIGSLLCVVSCAGGKMSHSSIACAGQAGCQRGITSREQSTSSDIKQAAIQECGSEKTVSCVPFLILCLYDSSQSVRGWAAWALGEIGDERAIEPLQASLDKYCGLVETDSLRDETKCIRDFVLALKKLTGDNHHCKGCPNEESATQSSEQNRTIGSKGCCFILPGSDDKAKKELRSHGENK